MDPGPLSDHSLAVSSMACLKIIVTLWPFETIIALGMIKFLLKELVD
jgi:hypothetical protein